MMATQLPLELPHRPARGLDDFLVAPSNAKAVAWIDRWPEWPDRGLALHGPEGAGKTHLVHVWQAASGARIISGTALDGMQPMDKNGAAVAVEDFAAGGDEEALLHLFNWTRERGGHVLLTGREAPARWNIALADLRSRLRALQTVALGAPDDGLLAAVIVKQLADRQLGVGREVIDYLVTHMERSFAAAGAVIAAIDRKALAERRRITVPLARAVLRESGHGL